MENPAKYMESNSKELSKILQEKGGIGTVATRADVIEKDKTRDKFLEGLGLTVLRFENMLVFQEPEYILKEIRNAFKGEDKCS